MDYGSYVYSVIVTTESGSVSVPTTVAVEVIDYTGIGENNMSFEVYPNPVHNTLHINGNGEFTYSLYNSMGQEMAKGNAQGSHQINVNNLTNGVYFLRITSGNQTNVQKIVVE